MVSVVMPNYNGERFVEAAIESVRAQSFGDWELLVVDDASTDASPERVARLAARDSRIRLLRRERNGGVAAARNTGIEQARGRYIALLDNDDIWEADKLERQLALAARGAELVYCSYDFIDENGAPIKRPFLVPEEASFRSMLTSSVISCSTALIGAELLKAHPFSAAYSHEDYVLWMELLRLPVTAVGDRKVLAHYRIVRGSRSHRKLLAARERWRIYRSALGLGFFESARAFAGYAVKGLVKYYLP